MIAAALVLGHGKCSPTARQPSAVSSGMSEPLNGANVQAIQRRIASGGVDAMISSGPTLVRRSSTALLWLDAAQVVSGFAETVSDMAADTATSGDPSSRAALRLSVLGVVVMNSAFLLDVADLWTRLVVAIALLGAIGAGMA